MLVFLSNTLQSNVVLVVDDVLLCLKRDLLLIDEALDLLLLHDSYRMGATGVSYPASLWDNPCKWRWIALHCWKRPGSRGWKREQGTYVVRGEVVRLISSVKDDFLAIRNNLHLSIDQSPLRIGHTDPVLHSMEAMPDFTEGRVRGSVELAYRKSHWGSVRTV